MNYFPSWTIMEMTTSTNRPNTATTIIATATTTASSEMPICRRTRQGQLSSPRRQVTPLWLVLALLGSLLLLMPSSSSSSFALAATTDTTTTNKDWIDPDTPEDQKWTQPYTAGIFNAPPITKKEEKTKHHHHHHTAAPTTTFMPSTSPSVTPTDSPTHSLGTYKLVYSDEFNTPFRTFEDGVDPRWTALEKNDYTNNALHYYSNANAETNQDGELVITTEATDTDVIGYDDVLRENTHVTKHFKSAMIQSWNKFCFTGGIVEAEVTLPGHAKVGGLWPAFWLLGNLARHTYVGSSEHIWPWSSTTCTEKSFDSQRVSGCDRVGHYGMRPGLGRGAPEIDIFEVQPGPTGPNQGVFLESPVGQPFMSASFQVAPGRASIRPGNGYWPGPGQWYEGIRGGNMSSLNIAFYGNYNHFRGDYDPAVSDYWSDAISFNRQLEKKHFNGSHVYRLEWDVPTKHKDGYLHWFLDGELVLAINGTGIKASGEGAEISSEPSYILLNTAVSSEWGFPKKCPENCPCTKYDCNAKDFHKRCGFSEGFCEMMTGPESPAQYKINWVRVYQDPNEDAQKVGCSTPERPTRQFIQAHEKLYKTDLDSHPLRGIQRGRGKCDPRGEGITPDSCGGIERGRCTHGRVCECHPGWTGPHCLSHEGGDPISYDPPSSISDVGFILPSVAPRGLFIGFGVLVVLLIVTLRWKMNRDDWTPIPDVDDVEGKLLR